MGGKERSRKGGKDSWASWPGDLEEIGWVHVNGKTSLPSACVAEAEPALHPGTSYQQVDTPTMQEQTSPPVLSVIASYFKCRGCGLISATTISLNCISSFAISVTWRQNICLRDKSHQYLLTFRLDLLSLSYTIYSVNKSPCPNLPFAH